MSNTKQTQREIFSNTSNNAKTIVSVSDKIYDELNKKLDQNLPAFTGTKYGTDRRIKRLEDGTLVDADNEHKTILPWSKVNEMTKEEKGIATSIFGEFIERAKGNFKWVYDDNKNLMGAKSDNEFLTVRKMYRAAKSCVKCGKSDIKLKLCAKCKDLYYCSRECQVADWKVHRDECKDIN